ncbi:hypothetical protein FJ414_22980 [Mesorhizobium sp. B3-1-6]|uniref:hypothetical protein n=1 Tax=Mesorhizobium sp. B3-1-6 TaxID=2589895 RepID=UPI00112BB236|nr:hypothetical protein [Mesorhizobium sp. B3-1-6]TPI31436.1 hypothetical protein FJ414_22980 [Mesorhizobium sp. B3-1-6]
MPYFNNRAAMVLATVTLASAFIAAAMGSVFGQDNLGTILDGLSTLEYDSSGPFALGDTVALNELTSPRERCIKYDETANVKFDTKGAVSSKLSLSMIKTYEDLENSLNFSFSLSASMDAGFAGLSAGGNASSTVKFDSFLKKERSSLVFVIEASADHGREYISDYGIKDEYKSLLDKGDVQGFIQKCGTNFVRAVEKASSLRVIINVSGLNSSSKTMISDAFTSKTDAKANIVSVKASTSATVSTNLADTLKLASKVGKIDVEVQAAGGSGLPSLGKIMKGLDLTDALQVKTLFDAMADASSDFTLSNAAPAKFVIQPYPQLKPDDNKFDPKRFVELGRIYKALLRVNDQLDIYQGYKTQNYQLWEKYFRVYTEKAEALRNTLVASYAKCRQKGDCSDDVPSKIDGLLLDDILYEGEFDSVCPRALDIVSAINPKTAIPSKVLSSIGLQWVGGIRYIDQIDTVGIEAYRITPDFVLEKLPFLTHDQYRANEHEDGTTSAAFDVYRRTLHNEDVVDANGQLDWNKLDNQRKDVARSVYFLRFRTVAGIQVDEVIGYPDMRDCKLSD